MAWRPLDFDDFVPWKDAEINRYGFALIDPYEPLSVPAFSGQWIITCKEDEFAQCCVFEWNKPIKILDLRVFDDNLNTQTGVEPLFACSFSCLLESFKFLQYIAWYEWDELAINGHPINIQHYVTSKEK